MRKNRKIIMSRMIDKPRMNTDAALHCLFVKNPCIRCICRFHCPPLGAFLHSVSNRGLNICVICGFLKAGKDACGTLHLCLFCDYNFSQYALTYIHSTSCPNAFARCYSSSRSVCSSSSVRQMCFRNPIDPIPSDSPDVVLNRTRLSKN